MASKLAPPRGIRNNNPGNIRKTGSWRVWQGLAEAQPDPDFLTFAAPVDGIRALAKTLITYYDARLAADGSRIDTLKKVIERWAPVVENDTTAYIRAVDRDHPKAPLESLDLHDYADLRPLVEAIIRHENGQQPYSGAQIDEALRRAGVVPAAPVSAAKDPQISVNTIAASAGAISTTIAATEPVWNMLAKIHPNLPIVAVAVLGGLGVVAALFFIVRRLGARKAGAA